MDTISRVVVRHALSTCWCAVLDELVSDTYHLYYFRVVILGDSWAFFGGGGENTSRDTHASVRTSTQWYLCSDYQSRHPCSGAYVYLPYLVIFVKTLHLEVPCLRHLVTAESNTLYQSLWSTILLLLIFRVKVYQESLYVRHHSTMCSSHCCIYVERPCVRSQVSFPVLFVYTSAFWVLCIIYVCVPRIAKE